MPSAQKPGYYIVSWRIFGGSWERLRFCSESSSQKYEKVMCSYICKIFQDCTEKDLTFEAFCTQLGSIRYIHICKSKTDFLRLLPTKSFAFAKYSTEQRVIVLSMPFYPDCMNMDKIRVKWGFSNLTQIHPDFIQGVFMFCAGFVKGYPGFIQILFRFFSGYVQVMSRFFPGFVQVFSRFYTSFVQVMSRFCPSFVQALSRFCSGIVQVLSRFFDKK